MTDSTAKKSKCEIREGIGLCDKCMKPKYPQENLGYGIMWCLDCIDEAKQSKTSVTVHAHDHVVLVSGHELLLCPFCEGDDIKILPRYTDNSGTVRGRIIKCQNPKCQASVEQSRLGWAVTAWNTRPKEDGNGGR